MRVVNDAEASAGAFAYAAEFREVGIAFYTDIE
jgi:hypothetical protein